MSRVTDNEPASGKNETIRRALFLHMGIVYIHPFADGNGRTARILQNAFLTREGYPPITISESQRVLYKKFMESAFFGKPEDLYGFLLDRLDNAMDRRIQTIEGTRDKNGQDVYGLGN